MKYCKHFGEQLDDSAAFCNKCGTPCDDNTFNPNQFGPNQYNNYEGNKDNDKSLKGGVIGFILTFFIGLIGYILCLCLGDAPCKKAAHITFFVTIGIEVLFIIIGVSIGLNA